MLKSLLELRLKQIGRAFQELSWYHFVLFAALLLYITGWLYKLLLQQNTATGIAAAAVLLVLVLHLSRNDKRFLAHLRQAPSSIFWLEYTLLLSPLLLLLAFTANRFLILPILAALLLISCLQFRFAKARRAFRLTFIADACFEWKAGVRKSKWLLFLLYVTALASCGYAYTALLLLWFITAIVSSFYQAGEPLLLLILPERGPKAFLYYRLKINLKQYLTLTFPLLLFYCMLHPKHIPLAGIFYLILLLVLTSSILTKYAHYEPNRPVSSAAGFLNSIAFLSPVLPPLLLFPLVNAIRNYKKAINRLHLYLDDFNQ